MGSDVRYGWDLMLGNYGWDLMLGNYGWDLMGSHLLSLNTSLVFTYLRDAFKKIMIDCLWYIGSNLSFHFSTISDF